MHQTPNPVIEREILDELRRKYIDESWQDRARGIHLTNLIYCLTRSFYGFTDPLPPSDKEVMLFALGFGLEAVLLREGSKMPPGEKDGIHYSPDFIPLRSAQVVGELKTTRMSYDKTKLPETWLEQVMGYCYAEGLSSCDIAVLHMLGNYKPPFPTMRGWHFEFDPDELQNHWNNMLDRKDVLLNALATGEPPMPKQFCKDWECQYGPCRYSLRCQLEV